jgi:hypothetical protein
MKVTTFSGSINWDSDLSDNSMRQKEVGPGLAPWVVDFGIRATTCLLVAIGSKVAPNTSGQQSYKLKN